MSTEQLLNAFYTSFANGDAAGMVACYHEQVVFSDPAFGTLRGKRAAAMWQMLLENKDSGLTISYKVLEAGEQEGRVAWTANYLFGPQKRKVVNHVSSHLTLQDGRIIRHADTFNFYKWSRQALGLPGLLLGWTPFLKKAVQKKTNHRQDAYMAKKGL